MTDPLVLDERGHPCPAPIITLGKARKAAANRTVLLISDDLAAAADVAAWCRLTKSRLLETRALPDGSTGFLISWP